MWSPPPPPPPPPPFLFFFFLLLHPLSRPSARPVENEPLRGVRGFPFRPAGDPGRTVRLRCSRGHAEPAGSGDRIPCPPGPLRLFRREERGREEGPRKSSGTFLKLFIPTASSLRGDTAGRREPGR